MRRHAPNGTRALAFCAALAALALPSPIESVARADTFDLSLQRLVLPPVMGGFADPNDARNAMAGVPAAYRQIVSELGVALAPKFLTPADTVGYNGFNATVDYSFTNITRNGA